MTVDQDDPVFTAPSVAPEDHFPAWCCSVIFQGLGFAAKILTKDGNHKAAGEALNGICKVGEPIVTEYIKTHHKWSLEQQLPAPQVSEVSHTVEENLPEAVPEVETESTGERE